eukprot:SAG22_NODE_1996_length_3186_cov_23.257856_6_plen_104_part_00
MQDEPQWREILAGKANSTNHAGPQSCLARKDSGCVKGGSDWGEVWQVGTEIVGNNKYMDAWMKVRRRQRRRRPNHRQPYYYVGCSAPRLTCSCPAVFLLLCSG